MIPLTQETKSKSHVSFKLDITSAKYKVIESFVMDYKFATNSVKACWTRRHVFVRFAQGW